MMTPRENFIRFLSNEPYEWIPSSNDICRFCPAFLPDHVARGMVSQQNRYTGELGGPDILGVQWRYDPNARGSMEVGSLCEDIDQWEERLIFPDHRTGIVVFICQHSKIMQDIQHGQMSGYRKQPWKMRHQLPDEFRVTRPLQLFQRVFCC